jgi:hypothetical protein
MVCETIITPAIAGDTMALENITSNTAGSIVLNSVFASFFASTGSPVAIMVVVRLQ